MNSQTHPFHNNYLVGVPYSFLESVNDPKKVNTSFESQSTLLKLQIFQIRLQKNLYLCGRQNGKILSCSY